MKKPAGKSSNLTPLMRQYYAVKEKHPDKILFFRMGDFYEMFGDDAVKAAPVLGIALTSRSHGGSESVPLAGVPHHSADKYLARLMAAGEKVVVVEQVEDPRTAKGIVKRDIVEILTPGTATVETGDVAPRSPCLAAIVDKSRNKMGMASLDMSTGSFVVYEGDIDDVVERLRVLEPAEILYPADRDEQDVSELIGPVNGSAQLAAFGEWNFDLRSAERDLNQHFGTSSLEGFGVRDQHLAVSAAGAILRYLKENHREQLDHIDKLSKLDDTEQMALDFSTVRNLELIKNLSASTEENSLFAVVNFCQTSAGARLLKNCLVRPFRSRSRIDLRLAAVTELVKNRQLAKELRRHTRLLPDLEMLAGRLGIGKLNPRQAKSIKEALLLSKTIKLHLGGAASPHLASLSSNMPECDDVVAKLDSALSDDPPVATNRGDIFKRGYSSQLDELNDSIRGARQYIGGLQASERGRTGIANLKVGFNKVFGYYIEVTKANLSSVPDDYIRKQTLVNAERYITPELKEKEELILNAEEKIFSLEQELYQQLTQYLSGFMGDFKLAAGLLAEVDLVSGLAELAVERNYCCPEVFEDTRLHIVNGRHPVIETVLPPGSFVANDIHLSDDDTIHILTGPNMSGKSTYLRQVGLIVILAQIGSYVPADRAEIGLVDRVFTRVGALDNLARGQSTFLVEMIETANILHNATSQSLVLLDEVGRGTSTFDGLSVAWAVVEHINEATRSRTIFATHYHELTSMAEIYERVTNHQVAVRKWENKVIFLHQIIPGGCDDSYGVEVARLAGLPRSTLTRARQILRLLESGKFTKSELGKGIYRDKVQPTLFDSRPSDIERKIKDTDLDRLTPLEALNLLRQLKDELE
ncbi:MAG: DNA mismatch repair protein MutS [Candidatus Zixiibacteriota bacterium]|nr:MAG: DNA mismatch repair protein MutS [candidate division Zixibacteria bacterium]